MKKNIAIRNLIKQSGIKYWEVADALGLTDGNFSRKLRKELSQKEKDEIIKKILEIKNSEEKE